MSRRPSLELDDLRTVVALAEELNFHRAGRKVGLSQPGVTRVLAKVERHVGTCLFERSHSKRHSVSPTDARPILCRACQTGPRTFRERGSRCSRHNDRN